MSKIFIYDTTLRDGNQSEDINLSPDDKLKIALKLDDLGVDYIEGGWPSANSTDMTFFQEVRNYEFKHARIAAFGSTHHPEHSEARSDTNLMALRNAHVPVLTIFGKTWDLHAKEALRVPLERNLELIGNSLAFLRPHCQELIFDAEHFFDGFRNNSEYALAALRTAYEAGADVLALCDTNGGTMLPDLAAAIRAVKEALPDAVIGIHAHNDCEMAVANSVEAVRLGATHVQGTINGYGERCGNANLCSVIPVLELKTGGEYQCLPPGKLSSLTMASSYISEVANLQLFSRQPFVGRSAFAHKGGIHASAVARNSVLYEHIDPDLVGNRQRVLLSEQAGRANLASLFKKFDLNVDKNEPVAKGIMAELKKKTGMGYDYAAAEASVELLVLRKLARRGVREFFKLLDFHVLDRKGDNGEPVSEASVRVEVEGQIEHTASRGFGPVNAMDNALRKALSGFYPHLADVRLTDFKVRVLSSSQITERGTASSVRVLIESSDKKHSWVTVGVSFNIIEASWQALVDSINYKLYKDEQEHRARHGLDTCS